MSQSYNQQFAGKERMQSLLTCNVKQILQVFRTSFQKCRRIYTNIPVED